MNQIFAGTEAGKKNIGFGLALFIIFGVLMGIPLTVDMLGGSMLPEGEYLAWKVIHAYGVFLAFVNFFFGYCVDRTSLSRSEKEIASWSFIVAGLAGAFGRATLLALSATGGTGSYLFSLLETVGFVIGSFLFIRGLVKEKAPLARGQEVARIS